MTGTLFTCSYPNGKEFERIISTISTSIDRISLITTKKGIRITQLDAQAIIMVDLWIPKEQFIQFDNQFEKQKFSLSLHSLRKLLDWVQPQPLVLEISNNKILFHQSSSGIYTERLLDVPIFDINEEENIPPKLRYNTIAVMSSKTFATVVRGYSTCHSLISLICEREKFIFEVTNSNEFNGSTVLHPMMKTINADFLLLEIKTKKTETRQIVGLNHLNKFIYAVDFSHQVEISMIGREKPVRIHFQIGQVGCKLVKLINKLKEHLYEMLICFYILRTLWINLNIEFS